MNKWSTIATVIFFAALIKILQVSAYGRYDVVATAFVSNQIVPDLVPQAPKEYLTVYYPNYAVVSLGNELTPTQVFTEPYVEWQACPLEYYTLMFLDPDALSRADPSLRAVKHWLVANIPGNQVGNGDVLAAYIGSAPELNTGLHRYTFLLYQQPGKVVFDEVKVGNNSIEGRTSFNPTDFATKYGLIGPIAGNFFQAQWDQTAQSILDALGVS